ncbi:SpoIIE family protein phosphatase [Streptomyces sp. MAR4 CNY-716]
MTPTQAAPTAQLRMDHSSAVQLAATTARDLAHLCRLPGFLPDQAAVLASELASNLVKHAKDGALYLQPQPTGSGLEILAADRGPGMAELTRCLTDGYSTTRSLGAGLGAVRRIASDFAIRSASGWGTIAYAGLAPPGRPDQRGSAIGALSLPADTEERCGDACAVADAGDARTALIVDGLGHGPQAAEAAETAISTFHRAQDAPLPQLVAEVHRALRLTRGAAVGLLRLRVGRAECCGIGNIRFLAVSPHEIHHRFTGQPGVVGWNVPRPVVRSLPLPAGTTLVLHTDGIAARWADAPSPFLLRLPPPLLAAALVHGHRYGNDDAAVLAGRVPRERP